MSERNKWARIAQEGASNRGLVARKLADAIAECNAEHVSTEEDPAVFLLCHQLTFLLTGHDFSISTRMGERWVKDTNTLQAELKED